MRKPILELTGERTVLTDGAMGTLLIEKGLLLTEPPEMWNITRPGDILSIHRSYVEAGADIILTNTFGATTPGLARFSLYGRTAELCEKAARLALSVCPPDRYVAGDMGPTGLCRKGKPLPAPDEYYRAFLEQSEALAQAGVHLLLIETQYDLTEALEALKGAITTGLPVFVTMTFEKRCDGFYTLTGSEAEESIKKLQDAGASAVGANCTLDSGGFRELADEMIKAALVPTVARPNAGRPQMINGHASYGEDAETFAENAMQMVNSGVRIIGACCGSNPDFIRAISQKLKNSGEMQ